MTKEQWVNMFETIGLSEKQMHDWHRVFETRHPEDHQAFLAWLNISADEIKSIRKRFQ